MFCFLSISNSWMCERGSVCQISPSNRRVHQPSPSPSAKVTPSHAVSTAERRDRRETPSLQAGCAPCEALDAPEDNIS